MDGDSIPPESVHRRVTNLVSMDVNEVELAGDTPLELHALPNEDFTAHKTYNVEIGH